MLEDDEDDSLCPHCGEPSTEEQCEHCGYPEILCETCNGSGVETYYVGTYGTYSCKGPAERVCTDCEGRGYFDA